MPIKIAINSIRMEKPQTQKNAYLIYLPILISASPTANHTAGANGLTNVPITLPIISEKAVDCDGTPN